MDADTSAVLCTTPAAVSLFSGMLSERCMRLAAVRGLWNDGVSLLLVLLLFMLFIVCFYLVLRCV